jgi:lysozyme
MSTSDPRIAASEPATPLARPAISARLRALAVAGAVLVALAAGCAPRDEETGSSVEEVVCASGSTVEGVDVSVYQGASIDWSAVHASGREFAITRINDGVSSLDSTFHVNWPGIRAAGMIRGAYQFFRPNDDAAAQARIVCSALGRLGPGDLPAMLDLEVSGGMSAATIVARITTWLADVESCTGKRPIIYTAGWFWNASAGSTAFGHYPLAVAAYGPSCPTLPLGWTDWAIFQYSDGDRRYTPSTGPVPGIGQSVDRDRYNGSLADLRAFANATPDWGAQFVSQSFPLASAGALQVHAGQSVAASITLRNVGTRTWNSNTRVGTTMPRDRASRFAGSDWVSSDRVDEVIGTVPPGSTYRFRFSFYAPASLAPGLYHEHFGVVQEGVTWFSAPGQAGPPDDQLEAVVQVLPALAPPPPPADAGAPTSDAGAATSDAGTHAGDAGTRTGDGGTTVASDAAASDGHVGARDGGDAGSAAADDGGRGDGAADGSGAPGGESMGGCSVHPGGARPRLALGGALLALAAVARRRRRRGPGAR